MMDNLIKKPKVALIQNRWRQDPQENLDNVLRMIDEIGHSGPINLICLPEFFLGAPWFFPGRSHLKGIIDDTIPGKLIEQFCEKAIKYNTYILCGSIVERLDNKYYISSALVDNQGNIIGKARKIHRYSAELLFVEQGKELLVVDTPFGKIGVCSCSDFWILEIPRILALKGAEIICVPAGALVQNLEVTRPCIQANSSHNVCYTLYCGIVGKVTGQREGRTITIELKGHSTVASPQKILYGLDDEEAVLYAELDLDYIREQRTVDLSFTRSLYWCLWGRCPEFYDEIKKPYIEVEQDLKSLLSSHWT